MIYLTSDSHFSHFNILIYCNRKYNSTYEMNKDMTEKWNAIVKSEDTVIHLGDFSFQSDRHRYYLNGKIILIRGNHDKKRYNECFDEVVDSMEMEIGGFKCFLTHMPIIEGGIYKKGWVPDFSVLKTHDYIICGHVHNNWKVKGQNVNVGVDVWDMTPININDLAIFLKYINENKTKFM